MAYSPHTAEDREHMLARIGVDDVDALFDDIPVELRCGGLDIAEGESEQVLAGRMRRLAARNRGDLASFLGAGVYSHYVPAIVDQLLLRGEFLTAYTPYQPEISQGTLQGVYEYQSLIAELTGLDVVSASHYDGASATTEAALMAIRATRRERVLISAGVHPHYRETMRTYFGGRLSLEEIPIDADGRTDATEIERALDETVAAVVLAQPNFFGALEDPAATFDRAHAHGALAVAVVEPVSLTVLASPGEYGVDIAAGEGQPLGIAPQYGGPYLGLLACRQALVRHVPGRLVGRTTDIDDRPAYVMTMRAREQDIRREKAASNICTNQALCALAATIYLSALGPDGLRDVALIGASRARQVEAALMDAGAERLFPGPYLNEFAVRMPNARSVHAELLERGVLAGLLLADAFPDRPDLHDGMLLCATETTSDDDLDRLRVALQEVGR